MKKKLLLLLILAAFLLPCVSWVMTAPSAELLKLDHLALPESLGKVQDRFIGTSPRTVVQIQDVHGHTGAQENIAAILDHLQVVYGIKTVAIEGAWEKSSLPSCWALPNSRAKQQIMRQLLEDGFLSGPPYQAVFAASSLMLAGIEDEKLYRENRDLFLTYLDQEKDLTQKLQVLGAEIQTEKEKTYNADLLNFDKRILAFRDGVKAESFLSFLLMLAKSHSVDFSKLEQVTLFDRIMQLSSTMNQTALQDEAQQIAKAYPYEHLNFEELLRSGKIPKEDMELYPEVLKYIETMSLQDKMDHQLFLSEIETLTTEVKVKLMVTEPEKQLDLKAERMALAAKILTLKAVPKDLEVFLKDEAAILEILQPLGLEASLATSKKFYELAKTRDQIFFEKITKDADLASDIAVVTGGFHTDGLSAQLRAAGISYVVVTPDLGGTSPNDELYHKMLRMSTAPKTETQTLSPEIKAVNDSRFDPTLKTEIEAASASARVDAAKVEDKLLTQLGISETATSPSSAATPTADQPALSATDQTALVEDIFKRAFVTEAAPAIPGEQKLVLALEVPTLSKLTEDPEGLRYWQVLVKKHGLIIYAINNNSQGMLPEILMDAVSSGTGKQAAQVRLKTVEGPLELLKTPDFKNLVAKKPDHVAFILTKPEELRTRDARLLALPAEPVSLIIFRMALLDPKLRAMAETPEGFSSIKSILEGLDSFKQFRQSA